jgi:hypothetical protein
MHTLFLVLPFSLTAVVQQRPERNRHGERMDHEDTREVAAGPWVAHLRCHLLASGGVLSIAETCNLFALAKKGVLLGVSLMHPRAPQ